MQTRAVIWTCVAFACGGLFGRAGDDAHLEKEIQKILAAQYYETRDRLGVSKAYEDLFRRIGRDGIRKLKNHKNPGVALRAGWEEVRLTIPVKEEKLEVTVDAELLKSFLAIAKNRLPVPVPQWWQKALLSAKAYRRGNIHFDWPAEAGHEEIGAGFKGKPGVKVTKRGNELLVTVGEDSVAVPNEVSKKWERKELDKELDIERYLSTTIDSKRAYLARYHDFPTGYPLYCVNRDSGSLDWTARIWADGGWIEYTGDGFCHAITIIAREKQVIVFGGSTGRLYVEGFDTKDGTALFRFCTGY